MARGIVFDMDGVLIDTSPIHEAAYREALRAFPIPHFRYPRVAGMRSADGMRRILGDHGIHLSAQEIAGLAAEKSSIALARIVALNPIVPGARAVLEALSKRSKLALASSASPAAVAAFLDRNELRPLFRCVVHSGDVQNAKPAPEIFELAIARLGLAPADAMVVEDAVAGIEAAKAAGATACGIISTCDAAELRAAGADLIIHQLADLLQMGAAQ